MRRTYDQRGAELACEGLGIAAGGRARGSGGAGPGSGAVRQVQGVWKGAAGGGVRGATAGKWEGWRLEQIGGCRGVSSDIDWVCKCRATAPL